MVDPYDNIVAILQPGNGYSITPGSDRAEVIIQAEGVTAVPNRRSYRGQSGGELRNYHAFAALKKDGSVVTWGESSSGGDSSSVASQLSQVTQIFSTGSAFAALKADGSVVTWGHSDYGGDSSTVADKLSQVTQIFSTFRAFAALKADGSVVAWGDSDYGGDSSTVASQLSQVAQIFSTFRAFAALKADGSVVAWGDSDWGGDSSTVADKLSQVTQIFSTGTAFAALKADGSVVTWGDSSSGGNSNTVADKLSQVTQIFSTFRAFAALKADGSVVAWGDSDYGGDSSTVASQLSQVTQIFSTRYAFAALKADGSVVTWGDSDWGGDSSSVADKLSQVTQIFSTGPAFAALKADGSVVTWGHRDHGGDSSTVADKLSQVTQIFSTGGAFAALKADGSVVTWGDSDRGGKSSTVASQLSQVTQIFSTWGAFAALKADGSVVTWGHSDRGGDSRSVATQLSSGVVGFATPYTDDSFNNAPTFNNQTFTLAENSTNNTLIGTLVATDPEGDNLTYSITNNSDPNNNGTPAFLLQGNQLLVNDQEDLNYETNPTLSITVQASDGSGTNDATITVNLTDVNERPIITSSDTVDVPENTKKVLTVQATDPEGDSLTFSIIEIADADSFRIDPNTGNLSFKTAPNFENPASEAKTNTYQVLVEVTDNSPYNLQDMGVLQVISVTVENVNEVPTFKDEIFTLPENSTEGTVIGTLVATDPEEATLTYSITNNPDPNNNGTPAFLLQDDQLLVNDQEDLNYETNPTLSITAQASDGSGTDDATIGTNDVTITVNLTDVNEAPIITSPNTVDVPENTREVLTVQATDPEGDSLTFSIIGGADADSFQINPHTGNLSFKTAPDFENLASAANTNTYQVQVEVIDNGKLTAVQLISVTVTDVNEAPTFNNQTFTLLENSTNNTLIGTLSAIDPEGATLTYSITNNSDPNNNGTPAFLLQGNRLLVNDQEDLNYETNPTLSITAQASDGSETNDATIKVNLTDVIGEYGTLNNLNHLWQTITLNESYTNPVIIVGDPTFNSSDPVVSRLQNVGSNTFQLRLQEPNYLDNLHVNESVSYLVMEAGNWTLADGTCISAGTHSSNRLTSQGFDTINLTGFDSTPTVLSQVQTFNESDWVTTRTQGQSSSSFQVAMQEEEARNSGSHATETIGWLAIKQRVPFFRDPLLEEGTTSRAHTHTPSTVSFSQSFDSLPSVIAKLGSYYEGDTANLRLGSITSTGFEVRVHEEQSPLNHTTESISFLALEGSSGLLW